MTPQHFLIPLDFSDYSTQALNYAMELAHKLQARLTLLHVIQSLSMGGDDMGVTLPYSYLQDLDAEINRRLESYLERVMAAGLNGDKVIVHGSPYQEIVEIAKARQVDLIIMGTHGRTGLRHMLIGQCRGESRTASILPSVSDASTCRRGSLRIIAAITQKSVITRILRHLKLASVPPPIAPARSHQETFDWVA